LGPTFGFLKEFGGTSSTQFEGVVFLSFNMVRKVHKNNLLLMFIIDLDFRQQIKINLEGWGMELNVGPPNPI